MGETAGYRQLEHTADLALELWAASEAELLRVGARAVVAELTEQAVIEPNGERSFQIEGLDPGDRLVQWLNEVIVLALTEGFLFADATLALPGSFLRATVRGEEEASGRIRHELKCATYHDLTIERGADGTWRATVIIDV